MSNRVDILIDCDGVIADFVSAAIKAHGVDRTHDSVDNWHFWEDWGLTEADFWKPLRGADFWLSLEPYHWAKEFLSYFPEYTISTAPPNDSECPTAKIQWLDKHFGIHINDVMVGKKKWLMTHNAVLIDDSETNVNQFRIRGGRAVLFPQPWNGGEGNYRTVIDDVLEIVMHT